MKAAKTQQLVPSSRNGSVEIVFENLPSSLAWSPVIFLALDRYEFGKISFEQAMVVLVLVVKK